MSDKTDQIRARLAQDERAPDVEDGHPCVRVESYLAARNDAAYLLELVKRQEVMLDAVRDLANDPSRQMRRWIDDSRLVDLEDLERALATVADRSDA